MTVLDTSALLAFLAGERGAEVVEEALTGGAVVGAANWSEVARKVLAGGHDWELAKGLLASYSIGVEPVTRIERPGNCRATSRAALAYSPPWQMIRS